MFSFEKGGWDSQAQISNTFCLDKTSYYEVTFGYNVSSQQYKSICLYYSTLLMYQWSLINYAYKIDCLYLLPFGCFLIILINDWPSADFF